jgi:hypothetical protein
MHHAVGDASDEDPRYRIATFRTNDDEVELARFGEVSDSFRNRPGEVETLTGKADLAGGLFKDQFTALHGFLGPRLDAEGNLRWNKHRRNNVGQRQLRIEVSGETGGRLRRV